MHNDRGARRYRSLRLEPCEARLVMSIAPYEPTTQQLMLDPAAAQTSPFAIFDYVRNTYGLKGTGQTVAVIDTGIAYTHSALGAGYGAGSRVVGGWDFAENDANPYDDGPTGAHGTHVAGIIGSTDARNRGAATDVDFVALRVFNDQGNSTFDMIEQALRWVHANRNAFENPITTVNLSIGTDWNSSTIPAWATLEDEFAQLEADGIFIAVAAGNSFANYKTTGLSYPAASSYVVPVASVDANGTLSNFSQRDSRVIAAPGRSITSTVPDYLGNRNGIDDDFQALSGTSMAAPYVAGASVLLRQAMQFAGMANVTQDLLYQVMRNTADVVFDPLTNQTYTRLNVGRAIDSLMPGDDYGSTITTAQNLGTIGDTVSLTGAISRLDDRDCFTFTAERTGSITVTLNATGALATSWKLTSGTQLVSSGSNNTWTFQVIAGQSYTLDLGTSVGIGRYTVSLALEADDSDWGVVSYFEASHQPISGESEFEFRAARDGIMTIVANFASGQGSIDFDVYRADGARLGTATQSNTGLRFDFSAIAGQSYLVRARGEHADVNFRALNLVGLASGVASLFGTAGDDTISVALGESLRIAINGIDYALDGGQLNALNIDGGAGNDRVTIVGTTNSEHATVAVGSVILENNQLRVHGMSFENIEVHSGGGNDTATLFDSAGRDRLVAAPEYVQLTGSGFAIRVDGFRQVTVNASTGDDEALVYGSAGNDTLTARPNNLRISGGGYDNTLLGFRSAEVHAFAGKDTATIEDSAGDDRLFGNANRVDMVSPTSGLSALGFEDIRINASAGRDVATLTGASGSDFVIAMPSSTTFRTGVANLRIQSFDQLRIEGRGGDDQAILVGSNGVDTLTARTGSTQFVGTGFDTTVIGFRQITGVAVGNNDRAFLYDSAGDDLFTGSAQSARLSGNGFDYNVIGFSQVKAYATAGADRAQLATGDGDNYLDLTGQSARLWASSFDNFAYGFDRVSTDLTRGRLSGKQIAAIDYVYEQAANNATAG